VCATLNPDLLDVERRFLIVVEVANEIGVLTKRHNLESRENYHTTNELKRAS
jgi:hypothetical protein